jgi:hypothetical protein
MELDATSVHQALLAKGIDGLHHANTLQTSCLFLQHGRLLSRGAVEDRGLIQTPQRSDDLDKRYSIWHDVFLDSVDIHERASKRNLYGPVLLRFSLDLLLDEQIRSVWITRKNSTEWRDHDKVEDRYFISVDEFFQKYSKGDFGSMFMLRHNGGCLRLHPYLKNIVLDAPAISDGDLDLYSHSVGALRLSAWQGGLEEVEILKRKCSNYCKCASEYDALLQKAIATKDERELTKLFVFGGSDA